MRKKVIKRLLSLLSILTLVLSSVPAYAATQDIPVQNIAVMGSNELILTQLSYNPDNGWVQFVLKDEPNPFFEQDPIYYLNSYGSDMFDWDVDSNGLTKIVTHLDKIDNNNYAMRIEGYWDNTTEVPTVYVKYKSTTVLFARTMYELPTAANTGGGATLEDVIEESDLGTENPYIPSKEPNLFFKAWKSDAIKIDDYCTYWNTDGVIYGTPAQPLSQYAAYDYYGIDGGVGNHLTAIWGYGYDGSKDFMAVDHVGNINYGESVDMKFMDSGKNEIVVDVDELPVYFYFMDGVAVNANNQSWTLNFKCYSPTGAYLGTTSNGSGTVGSEISNVIYKGKTYTLRKVNVVDRLIANTAYVKMSFQASYSTLNMASYNQTTYSAELVPVLFSSYSQSSWYYDESSYITSGATANGEVLAAIIESNYDENGEVIADTGYTEAPSTYYNFQMVRDESNTNEFFGYLTLSSGDVPNPAYVSIGPEANSSIDVFGYEHTSTSIPSTDTYLYRYRIDIKGVPYGTNTYDLLVKYAGDLIYTIPVTVTNTREQDQASYVNPYGFDLVEHVYSNEILGTDDTRYSSEFRITGTFPEGWYTDISNGHLDVDLLIKTVWFEEFVIQPSSISIDGTDEYLIINADVTEFQTDKYDSNGNIIGHGSGIDDIVYRFRLMDGSTIHDEWLFPVDYVTEAPIKVSDSYSHGDYDVVDQESDNTGDEFSYWDDPWEERDQVADTGGGSSVIGETDSSGGSSSGGFVFPSIPDEDDLKNDPYQWLKDHMLLAGAAFAAVYFIFLNKN